MSDHLYFFMGCDTAPSESKKSDEGAVVVNVAMPRHEVTKERPLSDNHAEWFFDDVYARVFNAKQKLSARQWSGFIHNLHQRFGFSRICMDPGGGGVFVKRELWQPQQLINGVMQKVTPLGDQVDAPKMVVHGQFIVHLMKRGDPGIERVWPSEENINKSLAGDELLKDAIFSDYKEALDYNRLGMIGNLGEWLDARRAEVDRWPDERIWALKNLAAGSKQLENILQALEADGLHKFNSRGARMFISSGRDDIAMARIYSYCAFRIWLKSGDWNTAVNPEDAPTFSWSAA